MKSNIFVFVALCALCLAFAAPESDIVFTKANFSIHYPATWKLDTSGKMGTSFALFSPSESEQDKFSENVNLISQDLKGHDLDLNKYVEISEGQIKTMISNSNVVESKRIKKGSSEFHKMIYTGDQGAFHLQFEQYVWVMNDRAYILTFTMEQGNSTQAIGESVLNSFVLK